MKNLILKIEVPSGINLAHLHQVVLDAIQLPENVTNEESQFIDSLLGQLEYQASQPERIASIWHVDDVISTAEDMEDDNGDPIILTEAQAVEVLRLIDRTEDAEVGINWDVIREAIRVVIE